MKQKRVYTLYRVSTKKQVNKSENHENDIPLQREACHEYAKYRPDWKIVKEFEEKGVSGFKVSAKDRDAIIDLQEAALNNEFDVLLVFMFDRIGRIDDETPFIVEWFVKKAGIEVWSVKEGEQRFETHVDKLTNYIRFWQASGESEKTSIRVKSRIRQLKLKGIYTGGPLQYGYCLIPSTEVNRKGQPMQKYAVDMEQYVVLGWWLKKQSITAQELIFWRVCLMNKDTGQIMAENLPVSPSHVCSQRKCQEDTLKMARPRKNCRN